MESTGKIDGLLASWSRTLRAEGKRPATLKAYTHSVNVLTAWALEHARPTDPAMQKRHDIQDFIAHSLATRSSGTTGTRYRNLKAWFGWLVDEDEIDTSPMDGMKHPKVDEKVPAIIPDEHLSALLEATSGRSFIDRRDRAMIRVLMDTGMRRGELADLKLDDVDLDHGTLLVIRSKTHRARLVPIGSKAVAELDRYVRVRRQHRHADSPMLWLTQAGRGVSGDVIRKVIENRCLQAGIPVINPHRFRHTMSHNWLLQGGTEQDLARIAGWTPGSIMLSRYGASAGAERAREAHAKIAPGDRL